MKGLIMQVKSHGVPGKAVPHRVSSAPSFRGQGAKASSRKTNLAGGFMASRKKGSVRGTC